MNRKGIIIRLSYIFILSSITGVLLFASVNSIDASNKNMFVCAKIDEYTSLSEVEENSDIIVKGVKVYEEEPIIQFDENGVFEVLYTLSGFEIDEIVQNNSVKSVSIGDIISILENEAYDESNDVTYHIAGYSKMQSDNEYMLFLRYSDQNDWYIPTGVTVGKVPFDTEETLIIGECNDCDEHVESIEAIVQNARSKYEYTQRKSKHMKK